jgi:hypothetical protein
VFFIRITELDFFLYKIWKEQFVFIKMENTNSIPVYQNGVGLATICQKNLGENLRNIKFSFAMKWSLFLNNCLKGFILRKLNNRILSEVKFMEADLSISLRSSPGDDRSGKPSPLNLMPYTFYLIQQYFHSTQ